MSDNVEYVPITTEDAVEAVLHEAWLYRAEISDFRALIKGVQDEAKKRGRDPGDIVLRLVACRILECQCNGLNVAVGLDASSRCYNSDSDSWIEKPATVFAQDADFGSASFAELANLGATFTQDALFRDATFTQRSSFSRATFTQRASFAHATFTQVLHFMEATFTQAGDFGGATFGRAYFRATTFTRNTSFGWATFTQEANFVQAKFTQNVTFLGATFTREAYFWQATFARDAQFDGVTFTLDADFQNARVDRSLHFDEARISGRIRLAKARFGPEARLSFADIDLRPGGRIELTIHQIGRYRKRLIVGEDSRHDKPALALAAKQYNVLRDNFRALPSTDEEEDRCHYKYMDLRRRASDWSLPRRLFDWLFLKWCWGYGIYTKRIVFTMVGVVLVCGLVYHIFGGPSTIKNYYVPVSPSAEGMQARVVLETDFNPWYFSVITFTTIGYGDYAPLGWLRLVAGAEGMIGLFLMALFTVSFARKFIR